MLSDIPYSKLKENGRKYDVWICRDIHEMTLAAVAKKYGVSVACIRQNYYKIMVLRLACYVNHLSIVHGYSDTGHFQQIKSDLMECYGGGNFCAGAKYTMAYFEKEYADILREYRAGEPGIPEHFLQALPPFQKEFSEKTISSVIELRETEGLSYAAIGNRLHMTKEKAYGLYDSHYHALFKSLSQKIIEVTVEKDVLEKYLAALRGCDYKRRYDCLIYDYPAFA